MKIYNMMKTFKDFLTAAPQEIKEIVEICKEVEQRVDYHMEGSVYNHIKIVMERAIEYGNIDLIIAGLFHDLGKAFTTKMGDKGYWVSYGHEESSTKIVERNKEWISKYANYDIVHFVVSNHMKIQLMDRMRPAKVERLKSNEYFPQLEKFSTFDEMSTLSKEEMDYYINK